MSSRLLWLAGAPRRAAALFASGTDRLQQLITPSITNRCGDGSQPIDFDVVFQKSRNLNHLVLARKADTTWTPMTDTERDRRIRAYRLARDRAILGLREELRTRFAEEWATVVERGVAEGIAEFDGSGRLRLVAE
jgi:hypothetical protein